MIPCLPKYSCGIFSILDSQVFTTAAFLNEKKKKQQKPYNQEA